MTKPRQYRNAREEKRMQLDRSAKKAHYSPKASELLPADSIGIVSGNTAVVLDFNLFLSPNEVFVPPDAVEPVIVLNAGGRNPLRPPVISCVDEHGNLRLETKTDIGSGDS